MRLLDLEALRIPTNTTLNDHLPPALEVLNPMSPAPEEVHPGGIDIKNIDVDRKGNRAPVTFDAAALRRIIADGFSGLTPVFMGMFTVESPLIAIGAR